MNEYNFEKSIAMQQEASELFHEWLKNHFRAEVSKATLQEDLSGVDFIIHYESGDLHVQLKVDFKAHKTGNLPFEVISQAYHDKNAVIGGNFKIEGVDYIAYLVKETKKIYFFGIGELTEHVIKHYWKYRTFVVKNKNKGKVYHTLGVLVPIDSLMHEVNCVVSNV